jgi:hypothetical protein
LDTVAEALSAVADPPGPADQPTDRSEDPA